MNEKRKHIRYNINCKVTVSSIDNPRCQEKAKSVDISFGGIGLNISKLKSSPTGFKLKIFHPKKREVIEAQGTLAWQRDISGISRAGIHFTEIPFTKLKNLLSEAV